MGLNAANVEGIAYVALAVPPEQQTHLRELMPPRYDRIKGDHITLIYGVVSSAYAQTICSAFQNISVKVCGVADDGLAMQALLVTVAGETHAADNRRYHLTWSLQPDAIVPAAYGRGEGQRVRAVDAGYVSGQQEFQTFWPPERHINLTLSAQIYSL